MTEVKQIYDKNMYDINGATVNKLKHSSIGSGVVKEKRVVGFEEEVKRVIEKLDDGGQSRQLEIITIIGAGGSGKTTLAREVYHHRFTKYTFQIRAWVDVSQDYNNTMKRDLLICILKLAFPENNPDYEKRSEDRLGEDVHKCLRGRKYLIVMDDIWGIEAWNDMQKSFPRERKGSKVLFTSRLVVQPDIIGCVPHCLAPLPKSLSWELLQKKVFGMKCCPLELVEIGERIAEKCEGLPLAIVTIAGILATKDTTPDVWEEVVKHLSLIIAENEERCMKILELSYNHLPLYLKACFIYIGAFPEDYEIPVRELIWFWIAEGFIQPSDGGKSLEAIANDCLIDLIDRSLVMIARKRSLGEIKACRIHDLLRQLCLKKAEEDNFLVKIYEDDSFSPSATHNRRLFIGCQFFDKFSLRPCAQNLRSFLCLCLKKNCSCYSTKPNMSFLVENFELLRVLSFIPAQFRGKEGIARLVHLRYLAHMADNRMFPAPITYPLNLEILTIRAAGMDDFIELPLAIFKMVKLRHIYSKHGVFAYHVSSQGVRIGSDHSSGSKLDSLQTLHQICPCDDCRSFLVRTPNLRKLGVQAVLKDGVLTIPDLEFLKCLETLKFTMVDHRGPMASIFRPGLKLPPTVTRLTLRRLNLKWEELSILQTLPNLEVLRLLDWACMGPVWNTSEEGFSQLKYLKLRNLGPFKEWNASEDQFPRLEVLVIECCPVLEQIPIDFANLNELREINLELCTMSAAISALDILEEQRNKKGDDGCLDLCATAILLGETETMDPRFKRDAVMQYTLTIA
ncbi:putative late blight resistance protein homolog R1B-16 [Rhododendron vialii]|uniref:putative late blight resistance protein homolog R1B-16 n=1 Tax=Rhododendron vialii TaxID=182163 RepID=UPI00265D70EC|nr:putative late blight resistance protein homolog R1B-16 [Rhododendron vialii]